MACYHMDKNLMHPMVPTGVRGPTSPTDFGAHLPDHFPIAPMVPRMIPDISDELCLQSDACEDREGRRVQRIWESTGVVS